MGVLLIFLHADIIYVDMGSSSCSICIALDVNPIHNWSRGVVLSCYCFMNNLLFG